MAENEESLQEPFGGCDVVTVGHCEMGLGDEVAALIYVVPFGLFPLIIRQFIY
jgi:hypothetical protein